MEMRKPSLSKQPCRVPRRLFREAWTSMVTFRSKRRKELDCNHRLDCPPKPPRKTAGALFFALPTELQTCILSDLFFCDLLALRLASRSFHELVSRNEGPIVRHHIEHHVPRHILVLYPPPADLNLSYISSLAHRQRLSGLMAQRLAQYITNEIIGRRFISARDHYLSQHQRMRKRLVPLILTLFHFFEKLRYNLLVETQNRRNVTYILNEESNRMQVEIMETYSPALLLRVSQTYHLLLYLLCDRLTPSNSTFSLARARQGWTLDRPPEDVLVKLLVVGGLSQVERIWSIKSYSSRRKAVEDWICEIQPHEAVRRRTSLAALRHGFQRGERSSSRTRAVSRDSRRDVDYVPCTFELPMPPLSRTALARVIPALPPLPALWTPAARQVFLANGLDTADDGIWELFVEELMSGEDGADNRSINEERVDYESSSDEDPEDSEEDDDEDVICLDGLSLAEHQDERYGEPSYRN